MAPRAPKLLPRVATLAPCMLACVALVSSQGALANPHYRMAMSEDIHKNCKNFAVAADGTLTADCNAVRRVDSRRNEWYETGSKSIDLDTEVGNDQGNSSALSCGSVNFSSQCSNFSVSAHASGVDLSADCTLVSDGKTTRPRKTVNLNSCIKCDTSSKGDFTGR